MTDKTRFEIPESMRDMAGQSVDQAKEAYDRFMEASRKAQAMAEQSAGKVAASAKEAQRLAAGFAEENARAAFELAEKLVRAKDMKEALELQGDYARRQMEAYQRQARELTSLMAKSARDQ